MAIGQSAQIVRAVPQVCASIDQNDFESRGRGSSNEVAKFPGDFSGLELGRGSRFVQNFVDGFLIIAINRHRLIRASDFETGAQVSASDYVNAYLGFWCWVNETFTQAQVRNYLQSGKGGQSGRAKIAHSNLLSALPELWGTAKGSQVPDVFEVQGDKYLKPSIERVFNGKGAPDEIQDVLWLASLCGQVNEGTLTTYSDLNLGIDCGGFVANYWGMGHPSEGNLKPVGATGFLPRTIWNMFRNLRRKDPSEIHADDAAVFFQDVKSNNPDIAATKSSDGAYDRGTGSQAFHIGLVSSVTAVPGTQLVNLEIAESSGAVATSGGNGVNVRSLGQVTATVANGLVWCPDGANRIYFVGPQNAPSPYMPRMYGV